MPLYRVKDGHIRHNGKEYPAGSEIECSETEAALLPVVPVVASKKGGRTTVKEKIELIDACESAEEVQELIASDDRKSVLEAADKRIEELSAKEEG